MASINNTYLIKPNLSTTENIGILREKTWLDNEQPFGPSSIPYCASGTAHCSTTSSTSINTFGSNYFPGVSIFNVLGENYIPLFPGSNSILNIGPNSEGQAPNTGVFQNRLEPSADAVWTLGKHTVSFGTTYSYTQLNTIDKRTNAGTIATSDLSAMAQGFVTTGSSATGFYVTSFLQGNASRYYRANQLGSYVQDKFQATPTLSLTAGVRYDWDGGFSEKYGRIYQLRFQRAVLDADGVLLYAVAERGAGDAGQRAERDCDCGEQRESDQGRERHDADRAAVGDCAAGGRGVAAGAVPLEGGGADGVRDVLRPGTNCSATSRRGTRSGR